jgi:hypothetical protein
MVLVMFVSSCEETDSTPDCEKNDYGTVIVKNNTSTKIVVDVTEGSSEYNNERWISVGSSTTYNKIDAGNITVWASRTGDQYSWYKDSHNLSACEEYTYTWYDASGDTNDDALKLGFSVGSYTKNPMLITTTVSKNN